MVQGGVLLPPVRRQDEAWSEARALLRDQAKDGFGRIPAELLADHVLALDATADWPVRREALDALRRRFAFAQRDGLRILRRPAGRVLGEYSTGARGAERPYRTLLASLEPPRLGSCGCPDFRRGSLALCKHLLVVLDALASAPRTWERGQREAPPSPPTLVWDPVRPLLGADDPLARVRLAKQPSDLTVRRRALWFGPGAAAGATLRERYAERPMRRLALVRELERAAQGGDPALEARLAEEREELVRVMRLRRCGRALERSLASLKRPLYPYQREGVLRFLGRGRLLLADDMGLGKTVQAVAAGHALLSVRAIRRGLLVVPAPLKHQWLREWRATSGAHAAIVEGSRAERARLYATTRSGFLIANYEQLLRDLPEILRWSPELCVLDEAQRIKNWEAKTSHAVKRLRPQYRLVLTGTPMENRLDELASIVEWVDDHALEPKWRLVPLHAMAADGERKVVGARNLDTLRARLAPCALRRVRREVLGQLPPRTDTTVPIDLTPAQRAAHDDLDRPIASLLQRAQRRPLTRQEFLRLMQLLTLQRQICDGLALVEFEEVWPALVRRKPSERALASLDAPKLAELRAIVSSLVLEQGRRVVVFSQWRRMLQLAHWAVSDLLEEAGLRAVFFTGQEGGKRRAHNLVDFHDDPQARVLFASDAGGVGLNLQRAASACLLLELPWNPAVLEQRVGRVHRLGQEEPVDVFALVARGGIEERIAGLVADKAALFRGVFDGGSDEVLFDRSGSFLEQMRRSYEVEASDEEEPEDLDGAETADERAPAGEELERPEPEPAASQEQGPALPSLAPARLLAGLRVERAPDGGVRLETSAESAPQWIALLEGLASALRAGAGVSDAAR